MSSTLTRARGRIEDYDDPAFDPFTTYDRASGVGEIDDPYPRFQELHRAGLVQKGDIRENFGLTRFAMWARYDSYMVFGYDNVSRAFIESKTFSNLMLRDLYDGTFGESIDGMDAPDHIRYRALFQQAFLPKPLKIWGAELIPNVISRTVDKFKDRGAAELVQEFTSLYPFEVVYAQLGLPDDELVVFRKLTAGLMCALIDFPHANEASKKMGVYLSGLLADRRGREGTDFITMLANAEVRGERLPEEIAVSFLRQLMNAAGDTTYRSTGNLLVGLLTNPDQLRAVQNDRALIPQAIEEALRWEAPLPTMNRNTLSEVEMDGVLIPAGAKIDIISGTANRDPARHQDPDRFDISRPQGRHMAFAYGPHLCLGQHLARIEMERAMNILLDAMPNLRLDPSKPPPKITGLHTRAPDAIHVLFNPR